MRLNRQARRASAHRPDPDIRERAGRPISTAQIARFGVTPGDRPVGEAAGTAARRPPVAPGTATRAYWSSRPFHLCRPVHTGGRTSDGTKRAGLGEPFQEPTVADTGRHRATRPDIRPAKCLAERCQTTYRHAWQVPSKPDRHGGRAALRICAGRRVAGWRGSLPLGGAVWARLAVRADRAVAWRAH